ncbi:hypothetical protein [Romboutsia sp. 1001713B170207_170306_H8]|uniref:hypothetical protein n=1 Tax=Romboutsia sp. 1001713B170207_170306_H8 TaxID=2787112 RepID=UPI000822C93D|nr:hypothetical protein [Romboutsia sp. 1001713B170207_170306_H8]SCH38997.1 Uncharacterised protein [uncultured Clostridium sp.]
MLKKTLICLLIIFTTISLSNVSISMNEDNNKITEYNNVFINNLNNENIEVMVKDVSMFKERIDIGDIYDFYAIVTMSVENKGLYDIELCTIDIYPYQGNRETKYFVKTSDDDVKGFIGTVNKGEIKDIKVGVALYNKSENIKLNLVTTDEILK